MVVLMPWPMKAAGAVPIPRPMIKACFGVYDLRLGLHEADSFEHVEDCVDGLRLLPALGTAFVGELPFASEETVVAAHDSVVGLSVFEDADVAGVTPLAI
jgi:hypothetical protein